MANSQRPLKEEEEEEEGSAGISQFARFFFLLTPRFFPSPSFCSIFFWESGVRQEFESSRKSQKERRRGERERVVAAGAGASSFMGGGEGGKKILSAPSKLD